jgi:hypothetical protein
MIGNAHIGAAFSAHIETEKERMHLITPAGFGSNAD